MRRRPRCSECVFIDTNIFYNILFKTDLTQIARKLLEELESKRFFTSTTVINELLYVATRKYYQITEGIEGAYNLRKTIADKGYPKQIIEGIYGLLEELEVEVLVEDVEYKEILDIASNLKLLPSDVVIALTCKHYGISTILTFDKDFREVPWLRVIP